MYTDGMTRDPKWMNASLTQLTGEDCELPLQTAL